MKRPNTIILFAVSLVLSHFTLSPAVCSATDYYFHTTTTSNEINNNAPTATTAKFKDSPAVNRTTYQEIGVWSAAPLIAPMQLESLSSLVTWIGLKNSDDQGTYFDLKVEIIKNGIVRAAGETKNIQGVTRNPSLAKEVAVAFGAISDAQFSTGDVLSIRILTKVADSGGHNNAVGLRMYYDAVSRSSRFGAIFGPAPTKLVVTSVNSGTNPSAGVGFPVTLQSQDASGTPANVSSATAVSLSRKTGAGTLGGALTGTIVAGTNQVTITGVTYTKAESGVVITATRASGDNLTAGDSTPFTVNPGAATRVAFTTQPGSATAGSAIPGPPTVVVQDNYGNTVTSSTIYITVALGTNPGGSTLSGNSTIYTSSGVASFNDLSLNQAGTGYRLSAMATGLTGATSSAFNITAAAAVSLAAVPTSVPAGDPFIVTWAQIPNPTYRDWIGLFAAGSSDTAYLGYLYAGCTQSPTVPAASGVCSFAISASRAAGPYEFRLFPNDTFDRLATSNPVTISPPSNQNKAAISVGPTVTAGTPGFSVTVQSQTSSGVPVTVISNTSITVSLMVGNGVLGGTLSGTILADTNQVVIGPVSYSKAESGVVVAASRTSGDDLRAQTSLPFTVIPGPAAQLAFSTQPGNAIVRSTIPGPPTVTVQDNAGNTVTSTTALISIAIGANPGSATLDDNLTVTLGSSVSFPSLSINQPGNGYSLVASSADLLSATSNPFNITSPAGGGMISGIITRVINEEALMGAVVEAYQGTTLRGTAVTNASGNYSITGLGAGSYTVRASYTGLVPQMVSNMAVADGSTTIVSLSLNFGIAVQNPVAGATVNDFSVLVTGNFDTSLAPEVGITVNGYVALIDGDEFATFVPIDSQTTTLTATMTDAAGNFLAGDAVPITPQPPSTEQVLLFRPSPAVALVSQPVGFTLTSLNEISQIQLDGNGDGTIDFTGTTLDGVTVTFAEPGLYFPTVAVTDASNAVVTDSAIIQIVDLTQLDAQLRAKWDGMKNDLRTGDTAAAANYILSYKRNAYQTVFNNLTIPFASIDQMLGSITYVGLQGLSVEYEMLRNEPPDGDISYMVLFALDTDGVWRISFF